MRTNASAGDVVLDNSGRVFFQGNSTGANATITNLLGVSFVDFSATTFPSGGRAISAGSIAGTGTFFLGANQLTVGGNNLSTTVSGTIQDGGAAGGTGGSLVKIGTGTLILTGDNSYSGSTTVSAGTLQVDGSIAASSGVSVSSGAVLAGNGELASLTIQSGSTLAPGANAVGVLTVSGSLTFQSAAAYLVQVSPTSASSTLVSGSAAIAGTLTANALGGAYTADQIFPVLTATGPLTGTFNLATTGNFGSATLSLAYSAHQVFLIISAGGGTPPVWKAAPGSSDWNTASNWQNNAVPTATDIAQFNASTITTINIQQAQHASRRPAVQSGGAGLHLQHHRKRRRRLLADHRRQRRCQHFGQCSEFCGQRRSGLARYPAVQEFKHGGRRRHYHQRFRSDDFLRSQHGGGRSPHRQRGGRGRLFRDHRSRGEQPS